MTKFTSGELQRGITFVPDPQSPFKAGAIVNVGGDAVTSWTNQGWLECDGSEYPEASYAQLFSQIGSKYNTGGETASHFRVPNGPRRTVDIDLDVTGFDTKRAYRGNFIQDVSGRWYFRFNIVGSVSSGVTDLTITVVGIVFDQTSTFQQSVTLFTGATQKGANYELGTNNQIRMRVDTSSTTWDLSGYVLLESKPSDTVVGSDSRFSTFDEALESIPLIKAYEDYVNGSVVGINPASTTASGTIIQNATYAAAADTYGLVRQDDNYRTFSASFDGSAGASVSVTSEYGGSWVTSVSRSGAGIFVITINAGVFSTLPMVTVSGDAAVTPGGTFCLYRRGSSSNLSITINVNNSSGTPVDDDFVLIAHGPRP